VVRDGSRKKAKEYISGWHCMPGTKERVEEFIKKYFKAPRKLKVVEIKVRGKTWAKAHSPHNIILSEEIKILK
jgi:DNA polymerase II large subunit